MKHELEIDFHGLIFIYENNNENLVKAINGDKKYSFAFSKIDYDFEPCYFSFKNNFSPYKSLDDFKDNYLKDHLNNLEKEYKLISSKKYFDETHKIAIEYNNVLDEYEKYKKEVKGRGKKFYKNPIYLAFRDFAINHPIINHPLDIRFFSFFHDEEVHDPSRPDVVAVTHFYEATPLVSYDDYLSFISKSYEIRKEETKKQYKETIDEINFEYKTNMSTIDELLKEHDEVGLIYLFTSISRRMPVVEIGETKKFTLNDYLNAKANTIYLFKKPAILDSF